MGLRTSTNIKYPGSFISSKGRIDEEINNRVSVAGRL
jgi:hypothetical protein